MSDFVIIKGVLTKYTGKDTNVVIPDGVTKTGHSAFSGCSSLTSVTIPNSVKSIGDQAFFKCNGLTSVTIGNSVTSIGVGAFGYCSGLTSITIPDSVTEIGWFAFSGCSGLTSLTIPDSVTSIGKWAFNGCSSLSNINASEAQFTVVWNTLESGQKTNVAYNCLKIGTIHNIVKGFIKRKKDDVLNRIIIGDDVEVLEAYLRLFKKPDVGTLDGYIEKAQDAFNIKAYLIDYKAKNYTSKQTEAYYDDQTEKEFECKERTLTEWKKIFKITDRGGKRYISGYRADDPTVIIPSNIAGMPVYGIANNAFENCTTMISVTIENGVSTIGESAFYQCSGLVNITIPSSVISIGDTAFCECESLTSVTIPNGVTSIGEEAFGDCIGLTSITIPDSVKSIGDQAFYGCNNITDIYITDIAKWCKKDNGFVVSLNSYNLYLNNELITDLIIPADVTEISNNALRGCKSLKSVTIPDSVTSIGDQAFYGCENLEDVYISEKTEKFGKEILGAYDFDNSYDAYKPSEVYVHTPAGSPAKQYMKQYSEVYVLNDYGEDK